MDEEHNRTAMQSEKKQIEWCALIVTDTRLKITPGGSRRRMVKAARSGTKQCSWWCAACGEQCNWKDPNRVLVIQDRVSSEVKVFRAHAPPQGPCENLTVAVTLANSQTGADSSVDTIFEGLQEQSKWKITKVHRGGQPRGGEDRQREEELGGDQGVEAQGDLPELGHPGRGGRVNASRK